MELQVLGTGSSGNCYALHDGNQIILLDAGIPAKHIMRGINHRIGDVVCCLITHEHQDHCKAVRDLHRLGVPLYGTRGTREALPGSGIDDSKSMHQRRIGNFDIMDFPVIHDTKEPCGWLVGNARTGERLLYATDTSGLMFTFPRINYWLIECNYMDSMMDDDTPAVMRERLAKSHMSLAKLCEVFAANNLSECKQIILCHWSRQRLDPKEAVDWVRSVTRKPVEVAREGACISLTMEPF